MIDPFLEERRGGAERQESNTQLLSGGEEVCVCRERGGGVGERERERGRGERERERERERVGGGGDVGGGLQGIGRERMSDWKGREKEKRFKRY